MTEWFDRKPGSMAAQGTSDPTLVLVGDGVPDWVRTPPELGSNQVKVLEAFPAPCPKCKVKRACRHLKLGDGKLFVAECLSGCGFVWYR